MPVYRFKDNNTSEVFEVLMSISQKAEYMKENPNIESVIMAPSIVSGVSVKGKVPDGFKDVLSRISEQHKNTDLADRYGKNSIKEARTQEVVRKHIDRVVKRGE
jgi:predicted nucleic acid-binding Zn ribbon protein